MNGSRGAGDQDFGFASRVMRVSWTHLDGEMQGNAICLRLDSTSAAMTATLAVLKGGQY